MPLNGVLPIIFSLLAVLMAPATAGPAAYETIARLASASNGIVIASVSATIVNGTVDAAIQVERVLSGAFIPGATVPVSFNLPQTLWTMERVGPRPATACYFCAVAGAVPSQRFPA